MKGGLLTLCYCEDVECDDVWRQGRRLAHLALSSAFTYQSASDCMTHYPGSARLLTSHFTCPRLVEPVRCSLLLYRVPVQGDCVWPVADMRSPERRLFSLSFERRRAYLLALSFLAASCVNSPCAFAHLQTQHVASTVTAF